MQACYDGSQGTREGVAYVTLAGYVGPPTAWTTFYEWWTAILARWKCPSLHMADAIALKGAFTPQNGWSAERVENLRKDLINECLVPMGWGEFKGRFIGVSCTVDIPDYRRAYAELPRFQASRKEPEAICVDYVVTATLAALPDDTSSRWGKAGTADLRFDNNEPFLHTIDRIWRGKRNLRPQEMELISNISTGNAKGCPGIQAADFLAWHTNRFRTKKDRYSKSMTVFSVPNYFRYFDYTTIMETYR